jgi:Rnl2 family RNA ligase
MFQKYPSLENHYNSKFISKIRFEGKDLGEWVVREKIHGTNFSVIITKNSISACKRSGHILPSESFFGHEMVMKTYGPSFRKIQTLIIDGKIDVEVYQIFGEFAGGGIQKEVDYGEKDFYVFDILTYRKDGTDFYYDDKSMTEFCSNFGLKTAPLIAYGTFDELSTTVNDFDSVVNYYNELVRMTDIEHANNHNFGYLPSSEAGKNVAEGYVLKPIIPDFFNSGARIAIKSKNSRFTEKKKSDKPIKPKAELSENDQTILANLSEYSTWNRVSNVLSKIGEVGPKDFGKVMGLTMQDILIEAGREDVDLNSADDPSLIKKELQQIIIKTIREKWGEVVN